MTINPHKRDWVHQLLFYVSTVILTYVLFTESVTTILLWWVLACVVVSSITSAYYHRYVTHKSWSCPRWLEVVCLVLGAGHGLMSAIGWSNIHNKHHRFSDTPQDPHGPHLSVYKNLSLGLLQFDLRYTTRSIITNKLYLAQAQYYWLILIVYFSLWCTVLDPKMWFFLNACNYIAMIAVNLIGHRGNKPTDTPSLGLVLAGETYHAHHHSHPRDPQFGTLDPGWWFIRLFDKSAKASRSLN